MKLSTLNTISCKADMISRDAHAAYWVSDKSTKEFLTNQLLNAYKELSELIEMELNSEETEE